MPPGWRSVPLVLAATLRFWGCLTGDFVYDDDNIVRHPVVTFKQPWTDAFTTDFWGLPMTSRFSHKSYRPLAVLSFRWHAAIVPMVPGNTLSYHAVNVALHVANVLALWHLAARLLPSAQATTAYLSALAFAIHPLVSETVCCVTYRADLLATTTFLVSLLAYVQCEQWCSEGRRDREAAYRALFLASLLLGALSMLFKEQGVTVFGVLISYEMLRALHRAACGCTLAGHAPGGQRAAVTLAFLAVLLVARLRMNFGPSPNWHRYDNILVNEPSAWTRALTFHYLVGRHWLWIVWPFTFSHDWNHESVAAVTSLADPRNLLAVGVYAVIGSVAVAFLRWLWHNVLRLPQQAAPPCAATSATATTTTTTTTTTVPSSRGTPVEEGTEGRLPPALLWTFVLLAAALPFVPASNLFFYVGFTIAERIMYVSCAFCCLAIGGAAMCLYRAAKRRPCVGPHTANATAAVLALLAVVWYGYTCRRAYDWQDFATLLTSDVVSNPTNPKNWYSLGYQHHMHNQSERALELYEKAIAMRPGYPEPMLNMANLYMSAFKDHKKGMSIYKEMLDFRVREQPDLVITDKNHVSLFSMLALQLAMDSEDAEVVRNYTSMASKIMSSVNLEETEPLVAKIIGDQYSRLGQVSIAEQWFDRALQRRGKVEAHDVVRLCFEMAVMAERVYKLQHERGSVSLGEYLYQRLDAAHYFRCSSAIVGRWGPVGDPFKQAEQAFLQRTQGDVLVCRAAA